MRQIARFSTTFVPPAPLTTLLVALAAGLLVGCATTLPVGSAEQRQRLTQLRYPADADVGQPLHLEAKRHPHHLQFINREPRDFRRATVWLNQQYVGVVERIDLGPNNQVPLATFVNQHGEPFPTGTFLAPEDTQALVSVELIAGQDPNQTRRALTVWPDKRWFED